MKFLSVCLLAGDFRLCEAMASGALILVDHMYVPRPHPLHDGTHLVLYDNNNKTDLFEKLDKFRADKDLARKIGAAACVCLCSCELQRYL